MNNIRIGILAVLLALSFVMLAGCAGGTDTDDPSVTTTDATEATTTEATTEATTTEATDTTEVTDAPTPPVILEPSMHISSDKKLSLDLKLVGTYQETNGYRVGQGACTDGRYAYLIFENQSLSPHMCKIGVVDLGTYKLIRFSEPLPIDHGNDIDYNPKTDELIVSHNSPNRKTISRIDPVTLTVTERFDIDTDVYGITYRESTDTYCLGVSYCYDFAIYDSDFKQIKRWSGLDTGFTKQGIDSDSKYMYFSQYKTNCIDVYDWDGNYINRIEISEQGMELEGIFHIDDVFYVTFISGGKIHLYRAPIASK